MRDNDGRLRVWALVMIDLVLLGAGLLTFALFHHVLPQEYDMSAVSSSDIDRSQMVLDDGEMTDIEPPFTEETVITDRSYTSPSVAVELSTVSEGKVTYHIADIRIKDVSLLKTAFAKDTYGRSISEETPSMAERNNAIVAINGDYYGASSYHVAIRNGICYGCKPKSDVCVLYSDGTMRTFAQREFDADAAMAQGAWQAWSFGPALLQGGEPIEKFDSEISGHHPRSVIGYYEPGHYCFIAVDGRKKNSIGLTLSELSALCAQLGLAEAYNLDGGQTSMMLFGGEVVNDPYKGGRKCSDIIYICDTQEQEDMR